MLLKEKSKEKEEYFKLANNKKANGKRENLKKERKKRKEIEIA